MTEAEKFIDEERERALSDYDILKILEGRSNLLLYEDLANAPSLDYILGEYGACVILYQTTKNFGHWVCIFKRNDELVEYFDSYGMFVDDELKYIPQNFRKVSNQDYPHLTALMYQSPYKLSYNNYEFQKMKKGYNTCGRWVCLRILLRNMCLCNFKDLFKREDGDNLVTLITELKSQ